MDSLLYNVVEGLIKAHFEFANEVLLSCDKDRVYLCDFRHIFKECEVVIISGFRVRYNPLLCDSYAFLSSTLENLELRIEDYDKLFELSPVLLYKDIYGYYIDKRCLKRVCGCQNLSILEMGLS